MNTTCMNRARSGLEHLEAWGTPTGRGVDSIDPARLDMDSTLNDVLGQLFGLYGGGYDVLGLTAEDAVRLGFDCGPDEAVELTNCWRILLRLRANRMRKAAA